MTKTNEVSDRSFRRVVLIFTAITSFFILIKIVLGAEKLFDKYADKNIFLRNFFTAQANSLLNGRLDVSPESLYGECFEFNDKCFGYFGLTPSILRVPLVLINDEPGYTYLMVIVSIFTGVVFSLLILNEIWKYLTKDGSTDSNSSSLCSRILFVSFAISVGPGNVLFQAAFPSGYWEAIAWGSTLSLGGIYCVLKYLIFRKRYLVWLAILFFVLAANSRPNAALVSFSIAVLLIILDHRRKQKNLEYFCLALFPFFTMFFIFWMKFQTFIPSLTLNVQVPESSHWKAIYEMNGGKSTGLEFIPSNLFAYFRLDPINISSNFYEILKPELSPFVYVWPLRQGSMYIENSFSVTILAPFTFCLISFFAISQIWIKFSKKSISQTYLASITKIELPLKSIAIASSMGTLVTLSFVGNSQRYLVDFVPFLIMSTLAGLKFFKPATNRKLEKPLIVALLFLSVLGSIVNIIIAENQINIWLL